MMESRTISDHLDTMPGIYFGNMENKELLLKAYNEVIEKMLLNELQAIADKMGYVISKIEIEKK